MGSSVGWPWLSEDEGGEQINRIRGHEKMGSGTVRAVVVAAMTVGGEMTWY